jgi:hypothetical protein
MLICRIIGQGSSCWCEVKFSALFDGLSFDLASHVADFSGRVRSKHRLA